MMGFAMNAAVKPKSFGASFRRLVRTLRPELPLIAAVIVLGVVSVVFAVTGPKILGHATDILFSGVLGFCSRAGLVSVGVVAIDGTKMSANAAINSNRDFGQIAREILEEAAEIDRREDELYGTERGDELPEHLRTREGRREAFREAKERLERECEADRPVGNEDAACVK